MRNVLLLDTILVGQNKILVGHHRKKVELYILKITQLFLMIKACTDKLLNGGVNPFKTGHLIFGQRLLSCNE